MAQLSLKEQRELNKLIKENEAIQSRIDRGINVQNKTLAKQEQLQKKILDLEEKRDAMSQDQRDVLKESNKLLLDLDKKQRILNLTNDKFKSLKSKTFEIIQKTLKASEQANKNGKLGNDLLTEQNQIFEKLLSDSTDISDIRDLELETQAELNKAIEEGNEQLENHLNLMLGVVKAKKDEVEQLDEATEGQKAMSSLFGGFVDDAMEFKNANPIARGVISGLIVMAKLKNMMQDFSRIADSIGQSFGASVLQDFGKPLGMITARVRGLGFESEDVVNIVQTLNSEFGFTVEETTKVVEQVANISRALGVSVTDGSRLIAMFGKLSGQTNETAENILAGVNELARAEGVSPNAVLSDIANNAEFFAKFSRDGGRNVAEAAIQARKLGLSLSNIEQMMSNSTDLAGSLQAEFEAQFLLGRRINLDRLRFFKLTGNIKGAEQEILKLAGSKAEFDALAPFQKEALAKALQMELGALQKIVNAEDKRLKIANGTLALRDMSFDELVGEDAVSNLTNFNNQFAELSAIVTQKIVPVFAYFAGILASVLEYINESPNLLNALAGALVGAGAAMTFFTIKAVGMAVAKAFALATGGSILGPLGLIAGTAAAGAFIASMYGALSSAPSEVAGLKEGGVVAASPGGSFVNVAEGGESELITPLSKVGQLINVDTTPMSDEIATLKSEMAKTNSAVDRLISNMEGYFGFGGSAVKGIGRETIKAGTSIV